MSHKYDLTISTPDPLDVKVPFKRTEEDLAALNAAIESTDDAAELALLVAQRDGDAFHMVTYEFKRKLTRQQRLMMFLTVGEGDDARQLPDLPFLWRATIKSITGLDALGMTHLKCENVITDGKFIANILNHPDTPGSVVDEVTEYIIDQNMQSEDEGNA